MFKKITFFIVFLYFLTLIQGTFLVHFPILGIVPNLVLITAIFVNLIEKPENRLGLVTALISGFYLDVFSFGHNWFFGFYMLIFLIISLFIKLIFKSYVQIPFFDKI